MWQFRYKFENIGFPVQLHKNMKQAIGDENITYAKCFLVNSRLFNCFL